jgi:hypothetical protein
LYKKVNPAEETPLFSSPLIKEVESNPEFRQGRFQ